MLPRKPLFCFRLLDPSFLFEGERGRRTPIFSLLKYGWAEGKGGDN